MTNHKQTIFPRMTVTGVAVLAVIGLLSIPAQARFGGGFADGGFGRAGGGFRMGGDGFAGGDPSYAAWSQHPEYSSHPYGSSYSNYHPNTNYNQYNIEHPTSGPYGSTPHGFNAENDYSTNQSARFNEANSINQTCYNEAESMQHNSYENQSALSQQRYNQASNLQSNSHYDPYGGCCGWSGGSAAGAAAVGMMGGMAMGAAMQSAATPQQPTTVIENIAPPAAPMPYGTTLLYLPPGATPTQVNGMNCYYSNGTYYRPVFNGSQVVYVASPM
jgi:hypothetical protein